jgi:hypothetical protein
MPGSGTNSSTRSFSPRGVRESGGSLTTNAADLDRIDNEESENPGALLRRGFQALKARKFSIPFFYTGAPKLGQNQPNWASQALLDRKEAPTHMHPDKPFSFRTLRRKVARKNWCAKRDSNPRPPRCKRDALPLSYSRVDRKRVTANPVPARETPVAGMPGDSKINPDLSGTALAGRPEV